MDSRQERFQRILSKPTVDLDDLRELAWNGIPADLRPTCWRLLLGYAPPNRDRQAEVLRRKRAEYSAWVAQYYDLQGGMERDDSEVSLVKQIGVDVPRTAPGVPFFHKKKIQKSLERILFIRAIRNPASSYVQGINDLVTPFLGVFLSEVFSGQGDMDQWEVDELREEQLWQVEADCYWCLAKMLDSIQDHYTFAQPGIQRQVFKLSELVCRIDEKMHQHIEAQGLQFLQFAFRWFNCLVLREVPFRLVSRLWDTYTAEGADQFSEFLVYVCAALLLTWADQLKGMEFQDMVMFLQSLPTKDWGPTELEMVLSKAYMWRALFARSPNHLKQSF